MEYNNLLSDCRPLVMSHLREYASLGTERGSAFTYFSNADHNISLAEVDELQSAIVSYPPLLRIAKEYDLVETNGAAITVSPYILGTNEKAREAFEKLVARSDVEVIFDEREHEGLWRFEWNLGDDGSGRLSVYLPYASEGIANQEIVSTVNLCVSEIEESMYPKDIGLLLLPGDGFEVLDITQNRFWHGGMDLDISYGKIADEVLATLLERASWLPRIVVAYAGFAGIPYEDIEITLDNVAKFHKRIGVAEGIQSYLAGVPLDDICA